jgi:hypothetical protein
MGNVEINGVPHGLFREDAEELGVEQKLPDTAVQAPW